MAERDQLSRELIEACERGESGTVQELLSRGADPSYRGGWPEMTPLHNAARYVYVCAQLKLVCALQVVKHVLSSGIQYFGCRGCFT